MTNDDVISTYAKELTQKIHQNFKQLFEFDFPEIEKIFSFLNSILKTAEIKFETIDEMGVSYVLVARRIHNERLHIIKYDINKLWFIWSVQDNEGNKLGDLGISKDYVLHVVRLPLRIIASNTDFHKDPALLSKSIQGLFIENKEEPEDNPKEEPA